MADVQFTIAIRDDGTPVIRNIKREATDMGTSVESAAKRAGGGMEFFASKVRTAAGALAGLAAVAGVGALVSAAVVGMNASLEKAQIQFANLLGSADAAKAHVAGLFRFAAETPFETGPIIQASRALLTFGGTALATEKNLRLVGDAAAGTSQPIEEVAMWFGRAASAIQSGRPFGEAAQRLQELGILSGTARTQMEALGNSAADNTKKWQILTGEFARFDGQMKAQANTWEGLTSTISDNVNLVIADAFKPYFDSLKDLLKATADFTQSNSFRAWAAGTKAAFDTAMSVAKELTIVAGTLAVAFAATKWAAILSGITTGFLAVEAAAGAAMTAVVAFSSSNPLTATVVLSEDECAVLVAKFGKGRAVSRLTLGKAVLWIGRLGGHRNRQRDGRPGVRTWWRGLRDLTLLVEGWRGARRLENRCG